MKQEAKIFIKSVSTDKNVSESSLNNLLCSDPRDEFKRLLLALEGVENWTAAERATYFAFFTHGWYGRAGEAAYQDET